MPLQSSSKPAAYQPTNSDAFLTPTRPGFGLLMIVGIPLKPLELNALDVALGRFRVKGSNNGHTYNMRPAIEFSAKHNVKPHLTIFKLEELPEMIKMMHDGKARGRLGVRFD
jgi:alcohol dehydrogenase, propanol-preferring